MATSEQDFFGFFHIPSLEIFKTIPILTKRAIRDVPPYEKNGRGIPVNGTNTTIDPIFKNDCSPIQTPTQVLNAEANLSSLRKAIRKRRKTRILISISTITAPTNPNSSAITTKTESVADSGKKRNFWREAPSPEPKNPPSPKPNSICFT